MKTTSCWRGGGRGQPGNLAKTPTGNLCGASYLSAPLHLYPVSLSVSVSGSCSQMEKFELQLRNVEQDFGLWCGGREALGECECECEADTFDDMSKSGRDFDLPTRPVDWFMCHIKTHTHTDTHTHSLSAIWVCLSWRATWNVAVFIAAVGQLTAPPSKLATCRQVCTSSAIP